MVIATLLGEVRASGIWGSAGVLGLLTQGEVPEADAGKWIDLQTEHIVHPDP